MDRNRPLPSRAILPVLVLSLGTLGDTCRTGDPAAARAPVGAASAPATESPPDAEAALSAAADAAPEPHGSGTPEPEWAEPAAPVKAESSDPVFEATVRPILAERCAPCHNPGGQMYARLPWDHAGVVAANAAGIKRRLKGDDLKALEAWLATRSAAGS